MKRFVKHLIDISDGKVTIIIHSRKTLLFANSYP